MKKQKELPLVPCTSGSSFRFSISYRLSLDWAELYVWDVSKETGQRPQASQHVPWPPALHWGSWGGIVRRAGRSGHTPYRSS